MEARFFAVLAKEVIDSFLTDHCYQVVKQLLTIGDFPVVITLIYWYRQLSIGAIKHLIDCSCITHYFLFLTFSIDTYMIAFYFLNGLLDSTKKLSLKH